MSIFLCSSVLRLIERVERGHIRFRTLDKLHAKIYTGDHHAVLGSSNFSHSGLAEQREANVRFAREGAEAERYAGTRRIAENYWREGRPCSEEVVRLLKQLLQAVTWEEALARAVAELLEGEWIHRYPRLFQTPSERPLWPSQVQAVAQALWVLDMRGSVLIADPTGSGKTRLGVTLLWALVNRLWATGRDHQARCTVVCPPQVRNTWEEEADEATFSSVRTVSQGVLSHSRSHRHARAVRRVHDAPILFVDEAHNYLNAQSGRSRRVLASGADYTALLTATPINRGAQDLLRLVELLGLDNLSEGEYKLFRTLRKKGGSLSREDESSLRRFVSRFTVRRTKTDLNRMVDQEPEAYKNRLGHRCRYPRHLCFTYPTGESASDIELAEAIDALAKELRGLLYLRSLRIPEESPEAAVRGRLAAAAALARYNVRATLRSSPAALVEHVHGTEHACRRFGLSLFKSSTGNVADTLRDMRQRAHDGQTPPTNVAALLPSWLTDPKQLAAAASEEIRRYEQIGQLAKELSGARQQTRLELLETLQRRHPLMLAYDRSLITLEHLRTLAGRRSTSFETVVVTGGQDRAKRQIRTLFALGSEVEGVVALCSDAMSEGVNLQQASAVVFLDGPSVIRLAEQRVGRVDRMDSPHKEIEVHWPDDSPAFALRSSRRFVERYLTVDRILGSNMPLPEELLKAGITDPEETLKAQDLIAVYERRQEQEATWDGLYDAFQPVRDLISGPDVLVRPSTYEALRGAKATVLSKVSLVKAHHPWGFFAIRGTERRAPRWMLTELEGDPETELSAVCAGLRERLVDVEQLAWSEEAAAWAERLMQRLDQAERGSLPPRRRSALDLMERVLKAYAGGEDTAVAASARDLLKALGSKAPHEASVDLYELAQSWLDAARPAYLRVLEQRRHKPVRLKSRVLYRELVEHPLSADALAAITSSLVWKDPLERRVAACILGIPAGASKLNHTPRYQVAVPSLT